MPIKQTNFEKILELAAAAVAPLPEQNAHCAALALAW
jgi:hypothetical protein